MLMNAAKAYFTIGKINFVSRETLPILTHKNVNDFCQKNQPLLHRCGLFTTKTPQHDFVRLNVPTLDF
jgi:hypothetical protein